MAQEQKVSSVTAKGKVTYPVDPCAYQLLNVIGHGVSAVVYKATCFPLRSTVAIKAVDLERSPNLNLDSLRRETQTMALLSHPNLLTAHCSFIVGPSLWIVMPFMACGSLHSIITSSFPRDLDEPVIAIILRDTLKALDYLHCQGRVHGDIKASNILVDSDGTTKVADFGVVSGSMFENSSGSNLLTDVTGTPYWMAPEVLACKSCYGCNYKADMWSFGITALELAHGHPPLSNLPLAKALMSQASLQIASSGSSPNDKKFSKTFKEMVGMCLIVGDPSKRPSAEKLLKHPFFKKCKGSEHLLKIILKDLPSVEYRTAITIPRVDEDEEKISMKSRRISGWNFNEEILKMEPVFPKEHNAIKPITKIDEQIDTESEETITETLNVVAAVHEKPGEQLESTRALIEEQNVKANSQVMNHNGNQDEPCKTSLESEVETKDKTRRQDKVEMAEKESEEAMRLMMAAHLHSILSASLKQGEMVVGMMKMCGAADKICEDLRCLELWLQVQSLKMEIIKLQDEVDKHKRINQELESQHLKKKDESPTKDSS